MKQPPGQIGSHPCTSCDGCMTVFYDSSKVGNHAVGIRLFVCEACGRRQSQILGRTHDYTMSAGWAALVEAIGGIFAGSAAAPVVSGTNPVVRNPG